MARIPEIPRLDRVIADLRRRVELLERGSGEVYGSTIIGKVIMTARAGARMVLGPWSSGKDGAVSLFGYTGHPEERYPGFLAMDATTNTDPDQDIGRVWLWTPQVTEAHADDRETAHLYMSSKTVDEVFGSLAALKADFIWLECDEGIMIENLPSSAGVANVGRDLNGYLYQASSARRLKADIRDADTTDAAVMQLRPRSFLDKRDAQTTRVTGQATPAAGTGAGGQRILGLVAEEVAQTQLGPLLVSRDGAGEPAAVAYDRVGVALVPVVQRLLRRVAELEKRPHV